MHLNKEIIHVDGIDRNIGGDKQALEEIYHLFRDYYPSQLSLIRHAIDCRDCEELYDRAHKLKGSLCMFHAVAAVSTAVTLELAGRDGELEHADRLYTELESDIDALCGQIDQLIASY